MVSSEKTDDVKQETKSPKLAVMSASAIVTLAGALLVSEGMKLKPYKDVAGVWTVCDGLTGSWIDPNKTYTKQECVERKAIYLQDMAKKMSCVPPQTDETWIALGHFTYNIGTSGFCNSTLAKYLKEGRQEAACKQMLKWDVLTIKGKKVHCSLPENRKNINWCDGIMKRREMEHDWCIAAISK